jgi:hypothetical protein
MRDGAFMLAMQLQGTPVTLPTAAAHAMIWQSLLDAVGAFVFLSVAPQWGPGHAHRR